MNNNTQNNTPFWTNDPSILFDKNHIFKLWPSENMTRAEKVNAISRFVIMSTLLSIVLFKSMKILITGIVTLMVLIITYYTLENRTNKSIKEKIKEGFSSEELYNKFKHSYTNPTEVNPMMNVLLPEIQDNPKRLPAAPSYNNAVESQINEKTKDLIKKNLGNDKLFSDLGDNFEFEQSMRQFHPTANTRVPNNQAEFARFCYGNMASCKDGDVEMCNKPRHVMM